MLSSPNLAHHHSISGFVRMDAEMTLVMALVISECDWNAAWVAMSADPSGMQAVRSHGILYSHSIVSKRPLHGDGKIQVYMVLLLDGPRILSEGHVLVRIDVFLVVHQAAAQSQQRRDHLELGADMLQLVQHVFVHDVLQVVKIQHLHPSGTSNTLLQHMHPTKRYL